jgi:hypothetical protein
MIGIDKNFVLNTLARRLSVKKASKIVDVIMKPQPFGLTRTALSVAIY